MSTIVAKSKKHDGIIIPSKNNAEFGAIMVIETRNTFEQGFLSSRKRVGLLKGKITELQSLNWKDQQIVPLKVVYKEALEPFYPGQEEKKYPENHVQAGQAVTSGGAMIYVNKLVVSTDSPEVDILLPIDREIAIVDSAKAKATAKTSVIGTK
jgi:hypothetical protein